MGRGAENYETVLVADQSQLDELCATCRREKRFAFDTEFVMEDRFATEVCLIQVATKGSVAIIDPFLDIDLTPFWALVSEESVETVVHAGLEDFALCAQHTGNPPGHAYDVQIAAGLAGLDYPLSLQKLVQQTLHIRLHKAKTLTDWRKRPLGEAQIRYAAEDVAHLLAVRQKLDERLRNRQRQSWAKEEFRAFGKITLYRRAEEEKLERVKGTGGLKGRQLCLVKELLAWREQRAQKLNRPVRAVLKDHLLVEIAKLELSSFGEVRDLRGLNLGDRDVRALCAAVQNALKIPSDRWPTSKPRDVETDRETAMIAFLTGIIRGVCIEQDVSYGLVASKRSIRQLLGHGINRQPRAKSEVELLRGWRRELVGQMLLDVLAGQRMVTVSRDDGHEPSIRIAAPREG